MRDACSLVWSMLALLFRSRASLEAEILILRHQLNIQRRHLPKRLTFSAMDRLIFVGLHRLVPSTLNALTLVKPETVVRWHRAGFSGPEPSNRTPFLADFITTTSGFRFSVHTGQMLHL